MCEAGFPDLFSRARLRWKSWSVLSSSVRENRQEDVPRSSLSSGESRALSSFSWPLGEVLGHAGALSSDSEDAKFSPSGMPLRHDKQGAA